MFNSFGKPFFEAYEAISPLEPGFYEHRLKIYNLYPTLVHLRLFGDAYLLAIDQTLSELGI
jgi:fructosamine-3-kinase